jgi:coenzyme F420-reducing hydrogenase delta subunit
LKVKGVNPDRLQLWWVSAAEPKRFADKAREMSMLILKLPEEELQSTMSKVQVRGA